jgi:SOS-response transcriptional repressor LexA
MTTDDHKPVELTRRQAEAVAFIKANSHLYGPTLREIAAAMGIASVNGVQGHLDALEKKGVLERRPGIARGIQLTEAYR